VLFNWLLYHNKHRCPARERGIREKAGGCYATKVNAEALPGRLYLFPCKPVYPRMPVMVMPSTKRRWKNGAIIIGNWNMARAENAGPMSVDGIMVTS
jgi:hypothetical protein